MLQWRCLSRNSELRSLLSAELLQQRLIFAAVEFSAAANLAAGFFFHLACCSYIINASASRPQQQQKHNETSSSLKEERASKQQQPSSDCDTTHLRVCRFSSWNALEIRPRIDKSRLFVVARTSDSPCASMFTFPSTLWFLRAQFYRITRTKILHVNFCVHTCAERACFLIQRLLICLQPCLLMFPTKVLFFLGHESIAQHQGTWHADDPRSGAHGKQVKQCRMKDSSSRNLCVCTPCRNVLTSIQSLLTMHTKVSVCKTNSQVARCLLTNHAESLSAKNIQPSNKDAYSQSMQKKAHLTTSDLAYS